MVQWYVNRIKTGKMTLSEVLNKWYKQVKQIIEV